MESPTEAAPAGTLSPAPRALGRRADEVAVAGFSLFPSVRRIEQ